MAVYNSSSLRPYISKRLQSLDLGNCALVAHITTCFQCHYIQEPLVIGTYSSFVWDPYTVSLSTKVDQIQRRAARFVYNDYSPHSSVTEMLKDLGWDSLEDNCQQASNSPQSQIGPPSLPINNLQPDPAIFKSSSFQQLHKYTNQQGLLQIQFLSLYRQRLELTLPKYYRS